MRRTYPVAILAAGLSTRMGFPKLLLSRNGDLMAVRLVDDLKKAHWNPIAIVISDASLRRVIEKEIGSAEIIINPHPETGMIDSIRLALDWAGDNADGLLTVPIDHPLVSSETMSAIRKKAQPGIVVIPTFQNRRGHPTWWGGDSWVALRSSEADNGARHILSHRAVNLVEIPVADPAALVNIDTPEEAARWELTKFGEPY